MAATPLAPGNQVKSIQFEFPSLLNIVIFSPLLLLYPVYARTYIAEPLRGYAGIYLCFLYSTVYSCFILWSFYAA